MQLQKVYLDAFIRGFDNIEGLEAYLRSRGTSPYLTVLYKYMHCIDAEDAASLSHQDLINMLIDKELSFVIDDAVPIDIEINEDGTDIYFLLMVDIHLPRGATGNTSPRLSKAAKRRVTAFIKSGSKDCEKLVKDLDNLAVAILDSGKSKN